MNEQHLYGPTYKHLFDDPHLFQPNIGAKVHTNPCIQIKAILNKAPFTVNGLAAKPCREYTPLFIVYRISIYWLTRNCGQFSETFSFIFKLVKALRPYYSVFFFKFSFSIYGVSNYFPVTILTFFFQGD